MFIHTDKPLVTQQEAARKLNLSQAAISQLVKTGALEPATQVNGRSMLVTTESVVRYSLQHHSKGRPLSSACAMGLLYMLDGLTPEWLTPRQRRRMTGLMETTPAETLAWMTRKRARTLRLWCRTESLNHVRERSLDGGVSNERVGDRFDLPQREGTLECYMSETDAHNLMQDGWLRESEPQNVTAHVISDEMRGRLDGSEGMPDAVCAVDLMESADPREHMTGVTQFNRILQQWRDDR